MGLPRNTASSHGTVGIRQVAQRAGVSPGTVSNALNRPDRVAPATRTRIEEAIRELGFVRNGSASTLRAGQSRTVGLVVLDVGNPFFAEITRGVEDVVSERDHAVILCNSGESPAKEERNLRVLAEQQVRGVLITPAVDDPEGLLRLRARGIAVVLVDHLAPVPDMCSVAVDDVAGGKLAVAHLLGGGARRIAYVSGPATLRQCADRRDGALQALRARGHDRRLEEILVPEMNPRNGEAAARTLLTDLPDAIFCANDLLALGVLRALLRAGASGPGGRRDRRL